MKDFIKKKGFVAGVIIIILVIIAAVSAHFLDGRASFLQDAAGSIKSPVQRAVTAAVNWAEDIYGYLYEYDRLVAENESLRRQLAEAQEQARSGVEASEENQRLRELLNFQEKHSDFIYEPAKVVSWNPSNWASTLTISKGSDSGIELGDAVITEYGALVGQVCELGGSWATVRTIIDVETAVGALVGDVGVSAMIVGEFSLMKEGMVKLDYLSDAAQALENDIVLTSGKGGTFPQGLVVGTLAALQTEAGGQIIYGIVEPACDFGSLVQVFVIKDYAITE